MLYTAYNRDEAETYDLNKAISSGYDSLYTTAQDVFEKRMQELDKQIEIDAIQKANQAIVEVRQETEAERKVREKEREYEDIVAQMAGLVLENNENVLGQEVVERAKEKVKTGKTKSQVKEENVNEQEKVKRAGRPRKSA